VTRIGGVNLLKCFKCEDTGIMPMAVQDSMGEWEAVPVICVCTIDKGERYEEK